MRILIKKISDFYAHLAGSIAVLSAFCIIILLMLAGLAIDYARMNSAKSQLDWSLDAAALAAASSKITTKEQRVSTAHQLLAANIIGTTLDDLEIIADFTIDEANSLINARAITRLPTTLMGFFGIKNLPIESVSQVTLGVKKSIELALVLDYSGSMNEVAGGTVKYMALRDAAQQLVTEISTEAPGQVQFGIVPFSGDVLVSLPKYAVIGQSNSNQLWTGCTQDRSHPYNINGATVSAAINSSRWGQAPRAMEAGTYLVPCSEYTTHNFQILPLTNAIADIQKKLASMTPNGSTHIALGMEFGYALLDPGSVFGNAQSFANNNNYKFIVLLTDGAQTIPAFGAGKTRTVAQGEQNLISLCSLAKSKHIEVITVAVGINDKPTQDRLRNCASDPNDNYFDAQDSEGITAAFDEITKHIKMATYLSK